MGLTLTEREMLADAGTRFIAERYGSDRRRFLIESAQGFGREEWNVYSELGWLGIAVPAAYGGADGSVQDMAVIMETVGSGLLLEPILPTAIVAAGLIDLAGTPVQRDELLSAIGAGRLVLAFAYMEPDSGYCQSTLLSTVAKSADGVSSLSGVKIAVMCGSSVDYLIVSARPHDDESAVGLYLVPPNTQGVSMSFGRGVDDRGIATVRLRNASVPAANRLGTGDALDAIKTVLNRATLCVCAEAAGAMRVCNRLTVDYLKTRNQFGHPLSTFQALQHRLADMRIAELEARAVIRRAAVALDTRARNAAQLVSAAKIATDRSAKFIGEQAVQLHGGMGMTNDYSVGHYYKRLLCIGGQFGDADWHLERLCSLESIYLPIPGPGTQA
jgi:alkylation response protein AidB-like acyl-CoA dehydrogenase